MTWPQPKDRIVVSGHVDDVGETHAWIVIDSAHGISATGTPLLQIPISELVPELIPHVLLRSQWQHGTDRDQVMVIASVLKFEGRLATVEFRTQGGEPNRTLTLPVENLIFGRNRGR